MSKKNIKGFIEVHCSANMSDECDFAEPDVEDKTQCKHNHELTCCNTNVFYELVKMRGFKI